MEMWLLLVSKMNVHFVYRKQRSRSRSRSRSVRSMTTDSESEGTSLMGGYSSYSFSSACTDWTTDFEDVLVDDQGDEFDAQNMHRKSSAVTTDSEAAVIKLEESQNAEIEEVEESNSQQERKTRSFSVNDIYVFGRFPREPTRSSIIKSIHPIYSLALIYFACNWLRIPITLADIFR